MLHYAGKDPLIETTCYNRVESAQAKGQKDHGKYVCTSVDLNIIVSVINRQKSCDINSLQSKTEWTSNSENFRLYLIYVLCSTSGK